MVKRMGILVRHIWEIEKRRCTRNLEMENLVLCEIGADDDGLWDGIWIWGWKGWKKLEAMPDR